MSTPSTAPAHIETATERETRLRSWALLGDEADPRWAEPGCAVPLEVLGEPVVLVRSQSGDLRLLSNVCTHRGMVVATAPCRGELVCGYHGRAFGLDGRVLRTGGSAPVDASDDLQELPIGRTGGAMYASPLGSAIDFERAVAAGILP